MLSLVSALVKTITFNKVLLWALAMIITVVSYTVYERRDDLFQASPFARLPGNDVGMIFNISKTTKARAKEFVESDQMIVGLTILSADLRLNSRVSLFHIGDNEYADPVAEAALQNLSSLPLFSKSEENNRQMIKLINGEFLCVPYATSAMALAVPNANKRVITICRASLPPYYGQFSGFVSLFLNADPDIERQIRLKQQLEMFATGVYFRDVVPSSHKAKIE